MNFRGNFRLQLINIGIFHQIEGSPYRALETACSILELRITNEIMSHVHRSSAFQSDSLRISFPAQCYQQYNPRDPICRVANLYPTTSPFFQNSEHIMSN